MLGDLHKNRSIIVYVIYVAIKTVSFGWDLKAYPYSKCLDANTMRVLLSIDSKNSLLSSVTPCKVADALALQPIEIESSGYTSSTGTEAVSSFEAYTKLRACLFHVEGFPGTRSFNNNLSFMIQLY